MTITVGHDLAESLSTTFRFSSRSAQYPSTRYAPTGKPPAKYVAAGMVGSGGSVVVVVVDVVVVVEIEGAVVGGGDVVGGVAVVGVSIAVAADGSASLEPTHPARVQIAISVAPPSE